MTHNPMFRSEPMSLVQLYVPLDVAQASVEELAGLELVQFNDLNPDTSPFQRTYIGQIRRCDEASRRARFLLGQIRDAGIAVVPPQGTGEYLQIRTQTRYFDDLEEGLRDMESRITAMTDGLKNLQRRLFDLEEARQVLKETDRFFTGKTGGGAGSSDVEGEVRMSFDEGEALLGGGSGTVVGSKPPAQTVSLEDSANDSAFSSLGLDFVSGVIDRARIGALERLLWRVLRGNLYMKTEEIADSALVDPSSTSEKETPHVQKNVFIVFAHGSELLNKIRKIAETLGATLYQVDTSGSAREDKYNQLSARIHDLSLVLENTKRARHAELSALSELIGSWWQTIERERIVYSTLNLWHWDQGSKSLLAEAWAPTRDLPKVQGALKLAAENVGSQVPAIVSELNTKRKKPTFQRTNKFTAAFQAIIDSYGIASYGEVNPGLFAVTTFPFLFAVMFGDMGHGFIMASAAFTLILFEKKIGKSTGEEISDSFYYGRYIIFLMGLFAIFTGFLYNDIFSLSWSMWPSQFKWPSEFGSGPVEAIQTDTRYPFGLDPAWHGADNALIFSNSLKMKMSIVLGVSHMVFAVLLQINNNIHFKTPQYLWAEVLPQILFMLAIFGYLVFCIIYKWLVDWPARNQQPPSLLNMLIKMFLSPGSVDPGDQLFAGQASLQVFLLLLSLVCIPWMLCTKPYLIYKQHQKDEQLAYHSLAAYNEATLPVTTDDINSDNGHADDNDDSDQGHVMQAHDEEEEEEFDFGEVVIHQIIHTIEYCLNAVSNTASYLRLWALSLAHAQLSEVLWSMTMEGALEASGFFGTIYLYFVFGAWFILTIAILIFMEGLSAFLHALRLEWVEFNSKFYEGDGYAFIPLSFEAADTIP